MNRRSIRRTVLSLRLNDFGQSAWEHIRSSPWVFWIRAGSRHELRNERHSLISSNNMVFKGTQSRSAKRIAREVDAIGGNLDAFTGKETICFNLKSTR